MTQILPEKARLLNRLAEGGFNVPHAYYLPPEAFENEDFAGLEQFLKEHCAGHKIIVRSCHPAEEFYKGGTFDSLETYADVGGVKYARNKIMKAASEEKKLSILRQQKFNCAPPMDPAETGVLVMPFIEGSRAMAKVIGTHWEFGYCRTRSGNFECEPYITHTPSDLRLLQISEEIQAFLGFKCEIEYIISFDGTIYVVQAKDISKVDTMERKQGELAVELDGLRRIRHRRNYRERPIFVMDNRALYLDLIELAEEVVHSGRDHQATMNDILDMVKAYEEAMMQFALRHDRFAVLGLCIMVPDELFQLANHYLVEYPELQGNISKTLYTDLYKVDQFLAEADTLIAKDVFRRSLCSHDAYGINTVRNPVWSAYWKLSRHREVTNRFKKLGFQTGDYVGVEVGEEEKPTVFLI